MAVVVSMHLGAFSLLQRQPVRIAVASIISWDIKVMIVYFRYRLTVLQYQCLQLSSVVYVHYLKKF